MATALELTELVRAALDGATLAQGRVFTPRTLTTSPEEMPLLMIQTPAEKKSGKGRSGAPQFDVVVVQRVIGRLSGKARRDDEAAAAMLAALGLWQRQIERAVINNYDLRRAIQQYVYVDISTDVRTEGEEMLGELIMDFGLETYQGPEDFAPTEGDEIEEIAVFADLVNVFSSTGNFVGQPDATPFADEAQPAPRDAGPDGRAEGAVIVTLPQ